MNTESGTLLKLCNDQKKIGMILFQIKKQFSEKQTQVKPPNFSNILIQSPIRKEAKVDKSNL